MRFSISKRIGGIVLTGLLVAGCSETYQPESAPLHTLLTFTQNGTQSTADTDDWVIITTEDGSLLDYKPFESGTTIILSTKKTLPTRKMNVTLASSKRAPATTHVTMVSYLGIPIDQKWTSNLNVAVPKPVVGIIRLSLSPVPPPPAPTINFWFSPNDYTTSIGGGWTGDIFTYFDIPLYKSPSRLILVIHRNGLPYCKDVDFESGGVYSFDVNKDFRSTDHTIQFDYPGATSIDAMIWGVRTNEIPNAEVEYFNTHYARSYAGPVAFGYNDGYDKYKVAIGVTINKIYKSYNKKGTIPSSFPMLDYTYSVSDKSFKSYAFSVSGNYTIRRSAWATSNNNMTWVFFAPPGTIQQFDDLPTELVSQFRQIDPNTLKLKYTEFDVYSEGWSSFNDLLDVTFHGVSNIWPSYEYKIIQFQE